MSGENALVLLGDHAPATDTTFDETDNYDDVFHTRNDLDMARKHFVVKSNELIQQARYELTLKEQRLVLYIISKIKPGTKKEDLKCMYFKASEFCKVCGLDYRSGGNYKALDKILKSLRDKSVYLPKMDGSGKTTFSWILKVETFDKQKIYKLMLDDDMIPHLLDMHERGSYTQFQFFYVVAMKSTYSVRIYELLKSYQFKKTHGTEKKIFNFEELRILLKLKCDIKGEEKDVYPVFADFKRRVIEPAIKEINKFTDLHVEVFYLKKCRKVTRIDFRFRNKSDQKDKTEAWQNVEDALNKEHTNKQLSIIDLPITSDNNLSTTDILIEKGVLSNSETFEKNLKQLAESRLLHCLPNFDDFEDVL